MIANAPLHRRRFVAAGTAGLLAASSPTLAAAPATIAAEQALASIEAEIGGRVGVGAWDTGSGAWVRRRADERFAMCSTFKFVLTATVLGLVDVGSVTLGRRISYGEADLLAHSPVTSAHVSAGAMSVADLCAAAIEESDNGSANLLLRLVGGPAGLTRHLRRLGDPTTRLDRIEPALNTNLPGDVRDTTTPAAYVRTMRKVLLGDGLSATSRRRLETWMVACETGLERLRAGLPADWRAGDKTGTGDNGAVNDIAIVHPAGRPPILIAVFLSGSGRSVKQLSAAHVRIAHAIVAAFAQP
jgi:beta-lactamase class A